VVRIIALAAIVIVAAGILLFHFNPKSSALDNAGLRKGAAMALALESSRLNPGDDIPRQFTCDGEDVSPPLAWGTPPTGTQSFCLVAEDPDAPGGTFVHWLLYDLPANTRTLPENLPKRGQLPNGARQGRNGFGRTGYGGPCPPPGPAHRYFFRLYALDKKTNLSAGANRDEMDRAMKGHILSQADLMGKYKRQ